MCLFSYRQTVRCLLRCLLTHPLLGFIRPDKRGMREEQTRSPDTPAPRLCFDLFFSFPKRLPGHHDGTRLATSLQTSVRSVF